MLGRAYMLQDDYEPALEWIERALPAAGRAGDVEVVAEALTTKGPVVGHLRRSAEAVALLHGALALAESHGLYATRFRATYNLAGRLYEDDPAAAFRVLKDGLDLARRLGQRGWFVTLAGFSVGAAIDAGEWDWATAVADEVFQFEVSAEARLELETWLSNILAYRGEADAARRMIEGLEGLVGDLAANLAQTYWVGRAIVAMAAGRLEDAVAASAQAVALAPSEAWWAAGTTASAAFRLGDIDTVRAALAANEAAPARGRFHDARGDGLRADVLALEGRRAEASRLFPDVIRRYRELGVPTFAAETTLDFVLAMGADDPGARAAAEEARAFWTRLGAGAALERLDEAIARGPISPPSRPAARSAEGVATRR
jgi:tetratricopeptide (TPR) repeat protein